MRKEYKNEELFEFIEESLYLIINRGAESKTLKIIQSKLKGLNLEIFQKITGYYCLIRLGKLGHQKVMIEEEFAKAKSLRDLTHEAENMLNSYLQSINNNIFLSAISEIAYWIAKIECRRQVNIHKDFLSSWVEWHMYLEKKNKHKRKGEQMKAKLKLIMGENIENFEEIYLEHMEEIQRFEDGKKNIFVNIDHEIDIQKSSFNQYLILPEKWLGTEQNFRVIEEHTKCVYENEKSYTLKEYYLLKKDEIDEKWLKSKDLLKQILTIYLIKRCQNGDQEAFDKLFNLYIQKAQKIKDKYLKERGNLIRHEDVEGREITILTSLLKGDSPEILYRRLEENQKDKRSYDVLNKKPYVSLNESYNQMFTLINNQYLILMNELDKLEKNTKDLRNRLKKAKKLNTKSDYCNKIFSYSTHTLSKVNFAPTMFALFNPLEFLRFSPLHNKLLFRPNPNTNLTVWLFGSVGNEQNGMIWRLLCHQFDKRKPPESNSFNEDDYIEDVSGIWSKRVKEE